MTDGREEHQEGEEVTEEVEGNLTPEVGLLYN